MCVHTRACAKEKTKKHACRWLDLSYSIFNCSSMFGVRVTCKCAHWLVFAGLHGLVCAYSGVGSKVGAEGNCGLLSGSVCEPLPSTQQLSPWALGLPGIPASATSPCPSLCQTAGVFRYRLLDTLQQPRPMLGGGRMSWAGCCGLSGLSEAPGACSLKPRACAVDPARVCCRNAHFPLCSPQELSPTFLGSPCGGSRMSPRAP